MVHANTKIAFRSRSAHIQLLIQVSREMWDSDNNGYCYLEHALSGFLGQLFQRWCKESVTHSVSVVLFSRTWLDYDPLLAAHLVEASNNQQQLCSLPHQGGVLPSFFPSHTVTQAHAEEYDQQRCPQCPSQSGEPSSQSSCGCSAVQELLHDLARRSGSSIVEGASVSALDLYADMLEQQRCLAVDERGRVYEDFYMVSQVVY